MNWIRLPGAESCVGSVELARSVERRLGHAVFVSAAEAELAVEGRVERRDKRFRAVLSVTGSDGRMVGSRELSTGAECRELNEPLVILLALLIDPDARTSEPPPIANTRSVTPKMGERERIEVPVLVPVPVPVSTGWRVGVELGALAWLGPMPDTAPMAEFSIFLRRPRAAIRAGFAVTGERWRPEGSWFRLMTGGISFCPTLMRITERLQWDACVGMELGAMTWSGVSLDFPEQGRALFMGGAVCTRASYPLWGPLRATLEAGSTVSIIRPEFSYRAFNPQSLSMEPIELWSVRTMGVRAGGFLGIDF